MTTARIGAQRFRLKAKPRRPEADLQRDVAAKLRAYLPWSVWWTASLSGIRLTPRMASEAKRAGSNRGAPDLSFIWPDGKTTYIELKAEDGELSAEQKALARTLGPSMRVCRSWPEVEGAINAWMCAYDLKFLTDGEAVQRELGRRAAA